MAALTPVPKIQFFDANGNPLAGGKLYSYDAGTTTPRPTYTNYGGATPNANPVILDSRGEANVWLDSSLYKLKLTSATDVEIWTVDNVGGPDQATLAQLAASGGSALVGFLQAGTGAVTRTAQAKMRDVVSVKDFGAVCDGVTDDTAAVQAAIDYCATSSDWKTLIVNGKCRIASSLLINRLVDTKKTPFRIVGDGPAAGFYTTGGVTIFDTTLPVTTTPQSEFISFENLSFESSSVFNSSYVLAGKFLRISFQNCNFYLIRCMLSSVYSQSMYFINCDIRNNPASFLNVTGSYDTLFLGCRIYNGSSIVRCVDPSRGTNGLRFIGCMIENIYGASVINVTGASGFVLQGCHLESNYSPEFNFFAGGIANNSVLVSGNYIFNPNGATMYYGPTTAVHSSGNLVSPSLLHSNATQVASLVSTADAAAGGISDATITSTINGVYRAGNAQDVWSNNSNQIAKTASGDFAYGAAPVAGVRQYVRGQDQGSSNYGLVVADSVGNSTLLLRNDRVILMPNLQNYANDAAAAAAGIPISGLYRNGSVVQVRVV